MDLKDFVAESLRQIIDGVREAQLHAEGVGAVVVPRFTDPTPPPGTVNVYGMGQGSNARYWIQTVEYDVALAASESIQTRAGAGVLTVVSVGGGREKTESQEQTSRVKFSIPIMLPHQTGKPPAPPAAAASPPAKVP